MTTLATFLEYMEDAHAVGVPRQKQSYLSVFPNGMDWQRLASCTPVTEEMGRLKDETEFLNIAKNPQEHGLKTDTIYGTCPFPYKGKVSETWQGFITAPWSKQLEALITPEASQDAETPSGSRSLKVSDASQGQSLTILCNFVDDGEKFKERDEDFVNGYERYVNPTNIELTATDDKLGTFHYVYQPNEYLFIEFANVDGDRGFKLQSTAKGTSAYALAPPQTEGDEDWEDPWSNGLGHS